MPPVIEMPDWMLTVLVTVYGCLVFVIGLIVFIVFRDGRRFRRAQRGDPH